VGKKQKQILYAILVIGVIGLSTSQLYRFQFYRHYIYHIARKKAEANDLFSQKDKQIISRSKKVPGNFSKSSQHKKQEIIKINKADISTLEQLPGIGIKTAQNIVSYRIQHGNFSHPEDLLNVKGIGQKKLEQIVNLISFQ